MAKRPFIPAPLTAQVVLDFTQDDQPCENVLWYQGTVAWTSTLLTNLLAAIVPAVTTNWLPLMSSNVEFFKAVATDWSTQLGVQVTNQLNPPQVGSHGGASLPNNCTVAIKKNTALRGRNNRGRLFWIGLTETMVSDNDVLAGAIGNLVGAMGLVDTAAHTVNSAVPVVVSQFTGNNPRVTAVTTPITTYSIEQTLDSQRRRLPGHNRHR